MIGSQGIELFHEIATPKFNFEPVEEQCQESIISLTGEQMSEGLSSGCANSKSILSHAVEE